MTPCKDEGDFMAGNVLSQWCDWGAQAEGNMNEVMFFMVFIETLR